MALSPFYGKSVPTTEESRAEKKNRDGESLEGETLFEGIFRSLNNNRRGTFVIVFLALLATTYLHKTFPTVYESNALLRVLSTEETSGKSLAASMNGILSQRALIMEALKKDGLENSVRNINDIYSIEDSGPGLVRLYVRHVNPEAIQILGDSLIKLLSDKFLAYSSEADRFEIEALELKRNAVSEKIKETRAEIEKLKTVDSPVPDNLFSPYAEEIRTAELKVEECRQRLSTTPKIRVVSSKEQAPEYPEYKKRLSQARSILADLLLTYREKHPRVIKANAEISSIEGVLKSISPKKDLEESNPDYSSTLKELSDLENRLAEIRAQSDAQKLAEAGSTPPANIKLASIQSGEQRLKALDNMFSDLVMKLEQVNLKRDTLVGTIQVLRKDKESPQPIGLSFLQRQLIGLFSGTLFAIVLLYSPLPLKLTPEKIQLSNTALMGFGNSPESDLELVRRIMRVPLLPNSRMGLPAPENYTSKYDERLIVLNEPDSRQLGPLKSLLSNLQIQLSETGSRVLMISSSRNGMGRTTLVANLAVLFAQEGYSVVLVDANFRKPALHRVFDVDNFKGFSSVLSGQGDLEVIQPSTIKNLAVIPSGPIPPNPYELLGSTIAKDFLDKLKCRFELVLLDTPGLLDFPDAKILASQVSGVVFLHREGESETDIRGSREFLKNLKSRVLGFVQT